MNLLKLVDAIKEWVSPLALFFEGEEITSDDKAIGCLYFAGSTGVSKCYDPKGYFSFRVVITSCNLIDVMEYMCEIQPKLLDTKRIYDIVVQEGTRDRGYRVDDDTYEMTITFKLRN